MNRWRSRTGQSRCGALHCPRALLTSRAGSLLTAAIALCAQSGCDKVAPPSFSDPHAASYRMTGELDEAGSRPETFIAYRSGPKARLEKIELTDANNDVTIRLAVVTDEGSGRGFRLYEVINGRDQLIGEPLGGVAIESPSALECAPERSSGITLRRDGDQMTCFSPLRRVAALRGHARFRKRCEKAGIKGIWWEVTSSESAIEFTCLSAEGAPLLIRDKGGVDSWNATSLQIGAQPDALFSVPSAYARVPDAVHAAAALRNIVQANRE
jgi:hypothetical protein